MKVIEQDNNPDSQQNNGIDVSQKSSNNTVTQASPQENQQNHSLSDLSTLRAMRWFFLILVALWIFAAMVLTAVTFWITRNPLSFSLFSTLAPPTYLLYLICRYLFRRDQDYEIEMVRVQRATGTREKITAPMLKAKSSKQSIKEDEL